VFTFKGKPSTRMLNSAWLKARKRAKLPFIRVHDLKHTFGRRLRAAGVSFEDRTRSVGAPFEQDYNALFSCRVWEPTSLGKQCKWKPWRCRTDCSNGRLHEPAPAKVPQETFLDFGKRKYSVNPSSKTGLPLVPPLKKGGQGGFLRRI